MPAHQARNDVFKQIKAALSPDIEVESPVTVAAQIEELTRSTIPENQLIMKTLSEQIESMNKTILDMSKLGCRPDDFKDAIPPLMKEIDLLKSIRYAGVTGIFKRREMGIKAFARAVDEESTAIWIVGSSLKGLCKKKKEA